MLTDIGSNKTNHLSIDSLRRPIYTPIVHLEKPGRNSENANNNVEENNSGIRQARGYGLFERIKNFFRNLRLPRVFSKSILSRKAKVQNKLDENSVTSSSKTIRDTYKSSETKFSGDISSKDSDDSGKITDSSDKNSVEDVDENYVDKESEKREKDFLDITKYFGDEEMSIGGIQMQKIKVGDNVYVLPKGMYEKSNVDAEEAAKRIDFGKQIYEEIKDNKNKGENDFVVIDELSKDDISNLVWFLEYKACSKNNKYSSNSSNMRIPDNDGKIYDAICMAINKDKNDATGGVYGRGGKWMFGLIDESSHFKTKNAKTIKQSQIGLDFKFGKLPFGKRTIILAHGNPKGIDDIEKGTYLKLEDVGINGSIADTLEHGLNYFKSKGKVIQHDEDFREKLVCSKELSKYGKTVSEIYLKAENDEIVGEELKKVEKLLVEEGILSEGEKLLDREDLKIRLGRELILEDKDLQ